MGHYFIVGGDVELDEATKSREAAQRMKVEPRVLQGSPECLDHRIGERDLDLSQDSRQFLAVK
jgi:ABC-type transport system involved in Fe-S cluster assembly fused permease/ATPase subunit